MGEIAINPIHNVHKKYRSMNLVNPYRFRPVIPPFVSTWNTANTASGSSTSTQIKLPLISTGVYNFLVEWGDGNSDTITVWNQAQTIHTYSVSGTYVVKITGTIEQFSFTSSPDKLKILSVQSWGNLLLYNGSNSFQGCANLNLSTVTDVLNFRDGIFFGLMFQGCTALTSVNNINLWNTSRGTDFNGMFQSCTNFNQSLSFDTHLATNMLSMFQGASKFNSSLSFDTGNVTNMSNMFDSASLFNQNIGSFNVTKVTTFNRMFFFAFKFNNGGSPDIDNWVINSTLNVNMARMFHAATDFNQPIGSWNCIKVTTMALMLQSLPNFNQNIGGWNVLNVTDMSQMLQLCPAFNQNLGSWDVRNVANFTNFMDGKTAATFSTTNLDAIYNGWSALPSVKTPITITFGTAKYTSASSAGRAILTGAPNNWSITDGGI